jgi:hypothetical protein
VAVCVFLRIGIILNSSPEWENKQKKWPPGGWAHFYEMETPKVPLSDVKINNNFILDDKAEDNDGGMRPYVNKRPRVSPDQRVGHETAVG